jgi:hypothetical protein
VGKFFTAVYSTSGGVEESGQLMLLFRLTHKPFMQTNTEANRNYAF